MFGQETSPITPIGNVERSPTLSEINLWNKAEKLRDRCVLWSYLLRLQYSNIVKTAKFAVNKIEFSEDELPSLENRMKASLVDIENLRRIHCEVNGMNLGVSPNEKNDLDIVQPAPMTIGALWVPVAIGSVIIVGIIARWAYLEKEVKEISDKFNGILRRADQSLCSDPKSPMCQSWKTTKANGGYTKNETLIDSIKHSISGIGSSAATGIGFGLAVAVILFAISNLRRRS
jgi:hypothetical protein